MLPTDIRARLIAANTDLLQQELTRGSLPADVAAWLGVLVDQIRDHAIALVDETAPTRAQPEPNLPANVIPLRRRG